MRTSAYTNVEKESIVCNNGCVLSEGEIAMACYFMIDTYIDEKTGRGLYDEYIREVKPIVEKFGGKYVVRSEKVTSLHPERTPQRVITIRFPSRKMLDECFASEQYREISNKRINSVDARAVIVEEE